MCCVCSLVSNVLNWVAAQSATLVFDYVPNYINTVYANNMHKARTTFELAGAQPQLATLLLGTLVSLSLGGHPVLRDTCAM